MYEYIERTELFIMDSGVLDSLSIKHDPETFGYMSD